MHIFTTGSLTGAFPRGAGITGRFITGLSDVHVAGSLVFIPHTAVYADWLDPYKLSVRP